MCGLCVVCAVWAGAGRGDPSQILARQFALHTGQDTNPTRRDADRAGAGPARCSPAVSALLLTACLPLLTRPCPALPAPGLVQITSLPLSLSLESFRPSGSVPQSLKLNIFTQGRVCSVWNAC